MTGKIEVFEIGIGSYPLYARVDGKFLFYSDQLNEWLPSRNAEVIGRVYRKLKECNAVKEVDELPL